MKKYNGKIAAIAIFLALFAALFVFLCVWLFGADYTVFDELTRAERKIPGLKSGLSPQGLCPLPENEGGFEYAMSGYLPDKAPSRVYLIGEKEKYVTLKKGGEDISTHFGGITCTGSYLVVASGKSLVRFPLSAALAAEDGGSIEITDSFEIPDFRSVAYCYYYEGYLFAGEFYRAGKDYPTDESHQFEVTGGTNYAIIYGYTADESAEGGVASTTPAVAISVREQVQGFAIWEGGIVLSTSYGLPDSTIYLYNNTLFSEPQGDFHGIPLYILDAKCLRRAFSTPCMSEEIFQKDGRLYLLYESLSDKYRYFVRRQIDSILSLDLRAL